MIKLLTALLFVTSLAAFGDEVCFKSLYMLDLMKKMETKLAKGQCIDLKKHYLRSKAFAFLGRNTDANENPISTCMPARKAIQFCKDNPEVEICDSMDRLVSKHRSLSPKVKYKDSFEYSNKKNIISLISNPDFGTPKNYEYYLNILEEDSKSEDCLLGKEFEIAAKYTAILTERIIGDNGLSHKATDLLEGSYDIGKSEKWDEEVLSDLQEDCEKEALEVVANLHKHYTSSIKQSCLGDLAKKGLSIYDKKEIYCGGETPLACTLYKRAPASLK
ncbi:MAG: hypothetical protein ACJAT2_001940 [Bacteriovoracaceae bacterium]|jgi:hypothetical protein